MDSSSSSPSEDERLQALKSSIDASFSDAKKMEDAIRGNRGYKVAQFKKDYENIFSSINEMEFIITQMKTNAEDNKKLQLNNDLEKLAEKKMECLEFYFELHKHMYNRTNGTGKLFFQMHSERRYLCDLYFKKIKINQKNPEKVTAYYLKLANAMNYRKSEFDSIMKNQDKNQEILLLQKTCYKIVLLPVNKMPPPPEGNINYDTIYLKKTGDKVTAFSYYEGDKELTANQIEKLELSHIKFPDKDDEIAIPDDIINNVQEICGYAKNMEDFIVGLMAMKIYYVYKVLQLDPKNEEAKKMWTDLCKIESRYLLNCLFNRGILSENQAYELLGNIFNKGANDTFRKHFIDDAIIDKPDNMPKYLKEYYDQYKILQGQHAASQTTIVKQGSRDPNNMFAWLPNEITSGIIQQSASGHPDTISEQVHDVLDHKKDEGKSSVLQTMQNKQIADRVTLLLKNVSQHNEELAKELETAHGTQFSLMQGNMNVLKQKINVMTVLQRYLSGEENLNTLEATIQDNPLYTKTSSGKSKEEDFVEQAKILRNYLVPSGSNTQKNQ